QYNSIIATPKSREQTGQEVGSCSSITGVNHACKSRDGTAILCGCAENLTRLHGNYVCSATYDVIRRKASGLFQSLACSCVAVTLSHRAVASRAHAEASAKARPAPLTQTFLPCPRKFSEGKD